MSRIVAMLSDAGKRNGVRLSNIYENYDEEAFFFSTVPLTDKAQIKWARHSRRRQNTSISS
jgi:hypothetical protein